MHKEDRWPTSGIAAAGASNVPVLDRAHIHQICAAIGRLRFDGLLKLLANELVDRPATIRQAVLAGDVSRARHESHSLKGATTSFGAMALGNAAAAIEHASDLAAMAARLGILDDQAARTRLAIATMLSSGMPDLSLA